MSGKGEKWGGGEKMGEWVRVRGGGEGEGKGGGELKNTTKKETKTP